jgi:outer membrane protein OmpA-like peptidoglycan-associated protein
MNRIFVNVPTLSRTLIGAAVASLLLAACATGPVKPSGADEARAKLTQLQSNPDLATRAPVAIKEAELAVRVAEEPEADPALGQYRVYMADRKVDIATARAKTAFAEDQRAGLSQQRDQARLDARTREADASTSKLATTRVALADATQQSADLQRQSADLQRQLDELNAKPTDRGLVLTLGDVLFATGRSDLKVGATSKLNQLVIFLNNYPTRTVAIEGYTDNVGSDDYNLGLSQRRADSVKSYLTVQGIASTRLSADGRGESSPVAENDSAAGRQQNRRVEVIISSPPSAAR